MAEAKLLRLILAVVVLVVAVAVAGALVLGQDSGPAEAHAAELQEILDDLVTGPSRIAPGATAYVAGPHGVWTGSAGVADARTGEPMKPAERMRLESVSKAWTAALVLRLAADGRLRLDDTVDRWLPGLLPYGDEITIRELLDHTSGMVDSNDIVRDPQRYLGEIDDPALEAEVDAVVRRLSTDPAYEFSPRLWVEVAAAVGLLAEPGTGFHYSNIGYIVAGLVAERAGGADLATLFQREIIGPLDLTSAAYDPGADIDEGHALGYRVEEDGRLMDTTRWTGGLGANGGIVSNAADEGRFLQALMRGELLGPEELEALETASPFSNYGLGIGINHTVCSDPAYGHNGGGDGFTSSVYVSPDGDRVAVLLLNGRPVGGVGDTTAFNAMRRLFCAA